MITGLGVGGAERQVVDLADSMVRRGHEVLIVYLTGPCLTMPEERSIRIVCLEMRKSPLGMMHAIVALRRALDGFRPDVVHAHMVHANLLARITRLACRIPRLVCTAHNTNEGGWHRMLAYRLTDWLSDVNTNVSQEAVDAFVAKGAVKPGRMQAVPNGIDIRRFSPDPIAGARIRETLGVAPGQPVMLAVGRLFEAKDYPNLLRAFASISDRFPSALLWVVGDGPLRESLHTLARQLGIADRLCFLGVRGDVPALMNAADLFVLSSAWEGFGLVVAEAMASERVVVATDAGGVAEVLGDCGFLVPPRSSTALAAAMTKALELHGDETARLGRSARERVVRSYSIDAAADRWLSLYRDGSGVRRGHHASSMVAAASERRPSLLVVTTVPETLATILRDQPRFLSRHFAVHLMTSPGPALEGIRRAEGVDVHVVPMSRGIDPLADVMSLVRAMGLMRRLRPDAVHSYTPKAGLIAMVAGFVCRVPVRIHTFTGLIFPARKGPGRSILVWADRLIAFCATTVVPEGAGVKRDLERFGITRKPLRVIGHGNIAGVDTTRFDPARPELRALETDLRGRLGLPPDAFVFCYVGRLNRDKGVVELVGAFSDLPVRAHLIVIGDLDDSLPVDRATMEKIARHERIHWLGFLQDVRPALCVADVLVLPSYREGFPNVLLEAGAMGLPAIATDINGSNEIIEPGLNGWLVKPASVRELREAMIEAMGCPGESLAAIGHSARSRVCDRFDRRLHWQRLLDFYRTELGIEASD